MPLHVAVGSRASLEVIRLLVEAYPDAVKMLDRVSRGTSRTNLRLIVAYPNGQRVVCDCISSQCRVVRVHIVWKQMVDMNKLCAHARSGV